MESLALRPRPQFEAPALTKIVRRSNDHGIAAFTPCRRLRLGRWPRLLMRSLSDTIERLAAFRARRDVQIPAAADDRLRDFPEFGSNPGSLRARIYVPTSLTKDAPLVVVLHGCTQTAAAYDHGSGWSQLAEREGFALLFPEQQRVNNPNLCFNWFVPGDIRRDGGEALSIGQMIGAVVATYRLDRSRIFVTGLSAGGAMASAMLATYPELFAGGAIIAGLPYGGAST